MKKRILAFFLAIICGLLLFPSSPIAPLEVKALSIPQSYYQSSGSAQKKLSDYVDEGTFYEYLDKELSACQQMIGIYDFRIPYDMVILNEIAWHIYKETPEYFHVDEISVSYYQDTNICVNLIVSYAYSTSQYYTMLSECEAIAGQYLLGLTSENILSDAQKALILHDRLAVNCEYATVLQKTCYDMYGALKNGLAVCEGYAKAYDFLLSKLGIESYFCASGALNHAWNIVAIDGDLFHVDVTWDDQNSIQMGSVSHQNFLRSTQGMIETGHVNNDGSIDYDFTPVNTKYDQFVWQQSETEFCLLDGKVYYVDNVSQTLCILESDGKGKALSSIEDIWRAGPFSVWEGNFSKLTAFDQNLLLTKSDGVYLVSPTDGKLTLLFKPEFSQGLFEGVYGLYKAGDALVCQIATTPNLSADTPNVRTVRFGYRGDCNMDSRITSDDARYLMYHLLYGSDDFPLFQVSDFNQDKSLGVDDVNYLLYHTVFGNLLYPLQ